MLMSKQDVHLYLAHKNSSEQTKEYPAKLIAILSSIRFKVGQKDYHAIINLMLEIHQETFGRDAPIVYQFTNLVMQYKALYDQFYSLLKIMQKQNEEIDALNKTKVDHLFQNNSVSESDFKMQVINRLEKGEIEVALGICRKNKFQKLQDFISQTKQYRWLIQRNKEHMENIVSKLREWKLPNQQFKPQRSPLKQFLQDTYAKAYNQSLDCINIEQHFYLKKSSSKTCQLIDSTFRQQRIRGILQDQYRYFQKQKWFNQIQKLFKKSQIIINGQMFSQPYLSYQEERMPRIYNWLQKLIAEHSRCNELKAKNISRTTIDSLGSSISQFQSSRLYQRQRLSPTKSNISYQPQSSIINTPKRPMTSYFNQIKQVQNQHESVEDSLLGRQNKQREDYSQKLKHKNTILQDEIRQLETKNQSLTSKIDSIQNIITQKIEKLQALQKKSAEISQAIKKCLDEADSKQIFIKQFRLKAEEINKRLLKVTQQNGSILNSLSLQRERVLKAIKKGQQAMDYFKQQIFQDVSISSSAQSSQFQLPKPTQSPLHSQLLALRDQIIIKQKLREAQPRNNLKLTYELVQSQHQNQLNFQKVHKKIKQMSHILLVIKLKTKLSQNKIISAYFQNKCLNEQRAVQSQINTFRREFPLNQSYQQSQISQIQQNETAIMIPEELEQYLQQIEQGFIYTHWNKNYFVPVKRIKLLEFDHGKQQIQIGKNDLTINFNFNFKRKIVKSCTGLDKKKPTAFAHNLHGNDISVFEGGNSTAHLQSLELFQIKIKN